MKISNFRLLEVVGENPLNWRFLARVTVTTGPFWFSKEVSVDENVARKYGGAWFFTESGEYTPGTAVEELERVFEQTQGVELPYCEVES